jgi:serine/threonine protein kinase
VPGDDDTIELARSKLFDVNGRQCEDTLLTDVTAHWGRQSSSQLQGQVIDQKYKIIRLVGTGGMGAVYKAHHLLLNKEVALKILHAPNLTEAAWRRFQREAQAIARLSHPNIVQVFDFGVAENNTPYYTMEYLTGQSLADRLSAGGPIPLAQTVQLFLQICQGLAAAHAKGIIHRDLKPANIFLATDFASSNANEMVKIVDFGIAGLAEGSPDEQKLTAIGTIFGSPLYISPEQSLGEVVTAASDIYSCGCALFETLVGRPPFRGKNAMATFLMHQKSPVPELNDISPALQFPERMSSLTTRMLAKDKDERLQSFQEVAAELQQILKSTRRSRKARAKKTSPVPSPDLDADAITHKLKQPPSKKPTLSAFIPAVTVIVFLIGAGSLWLRLEHPMDKTGQKTQTKQIAKSQVRAAAFDQNIGPYLKTAAADIDQGRKFAFPRDKSLGLLYWHYKPGTRDLGYAPKNFQAQNNCLVPPQALLHLIAFDVLSDVPQNFSGFGPNDLDYLALSDDFIWTDRHMVYIGKLTGLHTLIADEAGISDKCIADLNHLVNLEALSVGATKLTGTGLSNLLRLSKLQKFAASDIAKMSAALKTMTGSQSLTNLEVDGCKLSDDDLKVIGTMTNLGLLDIGNNPKITDKGLQTIVTLHNLSILKIDGAGVSPACIKTLKQLPKLRVLCINMGQWSTVDKIDLHRAIPTCNVSQIRKGDRTKIDQAMPEIFGN